MKGSKGEEERTGTCTDGRTQEGGGRARMSSREELIIQQQIKIMEEVERKSKEREMRREQKKMRKQTVRTVPLSSKKVAV